MGSILANDPGSSAALPLLKIQSVFLVAAPCARTRLARDPLAQSGGRRSRRHGISSVRLTGRIDHSVKLRARASASVRQRLAVQVLALDHIERAAGIRSSFKMAPPAGLERAITLHFTRQAIR